jgi:ATPase family AAA domain-containing protein 3A/B
MFSIQFHFSQVSRSRKGVLLFIDEADSFLSARTAGMSEHLRNSLTTMLFHTGTATSQFMLVMATNRPGEYDLTTLEMRVEDDKYTRNESKR